MSHRIGEEFEARISGVAAFGMFAELPNTCEGLIPLESLASVYTYEETTLSLRGKDSVYRIGDRIRIRVEEADIPTHRVRFSVVGDNAEDDTEEEEELPDIYSFDLPYARAPKRKKRR